MHDFTYSSEIKFAHEETARRMHHRHVRFGAPLSAHARHGEMADEAAVTLDEFTRRMVVVSFHDFASHASGSARHTEVLASARRTDGNMDDHTASPTLVCAHTSTHLCIQ